MKEHACEGLYYSFRIMRDLIHPIFMPELKIIENNLGFWDLVKGKEIISFSLEFCPFCGTKLQERI